MKNEELKGKAAIVTGASRGIGKAIALAMADAGAAIAVVARTVDDTGPLKGTITKTAEEIRERGGQAFPIQANVAEETDVEKMVDETVQRFGSVDILINNAATNIPSSFIESRIRHWDLIVRVTLRSVIICSKAVLPTMMQQGHGSIINISSIAAVIRGIPLTGLAYDVCKAGINRFTWGLAEELKEYSIAVNALMPGNTVTEGWSMLNPDVNKSRWQTPELWGEIATFVATRDPARYTGNILTAEDAQKEMVAAGWNSQHKGNGKSAIEPQH